jgi:hypothetical protein
MIIRIHNNDSTDYVDYEADTIDEIKELCKERILLPTWDKGWSEVIEE